jgi:autotransporter-associated beta strand protein
LSANGGISGNAALTLTGGGTVALGGPASYTGDTTISSGTLKLGAANVLPGGAGVGNLNVNGTLDLNGYSQTINALANNGVVDNTAAGAVTLTVGGNDAVSTVNGIIQNTGGALTLAKTGNGNLTLNSSNSYSGGTLINASYVYPKDNSSFGTGPITVNGGTVYAVGGNYVFSNAVTLNGGTLELGGGSGKTVTWAGPLSVTADSTLTADGGTSGFTVADALDMGSGGYTLTAFAGGGAGVTLLSGPISGATGTIEVTGGTLKLSGTNSFGGTLRSGAGSLSIANVYAATNATIDYNAADSGSVNYNSLNCILGALSGSRSFAFGPTLSIGNNGSSTTYSGAMSGGGSIIKIGAGTWTLTGTNTYTGNTTINGGTLALSGTGSLASPVITVAGGTTLDVSGLTSAFVLGAGQTLSNRTSTAMLNGDIDASAGTVSLTYAAGTPAMTMAGGTLTLATGTTFTVDNTGSALPAGVYPLIAASGGAVSGTLPAVTVTDGGVVAGAAAFLQLNGSELDLVVDHAPVAGPSFTLGCVLGQSNTVAIIGGKYSPADVDSGDTLTITSVTGAANGTVTTDGTNVTYTANSGTSDSFTYTVSDSHGLTASQTVNVTITPAQGYNQLGNPQLIGGAAVMTFYGIPGYKYALDWATTLTPPNWTPVMTNTAAANGLLMLTNSTPSGTDFYRTRYVP